MNVLRLIHSNSDMNSNAQLKPLLRVIWQMHGDASL